MEKIEKTSPELSDQDLQAMDQSFREEKDYFEKEKLRHNAIWLFDTLIKEKKVTADTKIGDLIEIIKTEQEYYSGQGGWAHYAQKDNLWAVNESQPDNVSDEFGRVAEEEHEKSKRVFRYCKDALAVLDELQKEDAINDDSALKDAKSIINTRLTRPEDRMVEEETKRREVEKEPHEK